MQSLHSPAIRNFFAAVLMLRFQNKDVGDKLTKLRGIFWSLVIFVLVCATLQMFSMFSTGPFPVYMLQNVLSIT